MLLTKQVIDGAQELIRMAEDCEQALNDPQCSFLDRMDFRKRAASYRAEASNLLGTDAGLDADGSWHAPNSGEMPWKPNPWEDLEPIYLRHKQLSGPRIVFYVLALLSVFIWGVTHYAAQIDALLRRWIG